MTEQQAVVDKAEASATPDARVDSARKDDDLDSLLAQFDEGVKTASPPETKVDTAKESVPTWAQDLQRRFIQEDIQKVTEEIFDGLDVSDRLKNAWVDQIAREKPAVGRAFLNRHNDPTTWKRVMKGLKPEAQRDFPGAKKVDPDATADHDAVAQAVRGASTKVAAEPAPDFSKMTDAELNAWKMANMKR